MMSPVKSLVQKKYYCLIVHVQGQKLCIYKRAQIVIADIWACCGGEGYGHFNDIDSITMFADYRIPQGKQAFSYNILYMIYILLTPPSAWYTSY